MATATDLAVARDVASVYHEHHHGRDASPAAQDGDAAANDTFADDASSTDDGSSTATSTTTTTARVTRASFSSTGSSHLPSPVLTPRLRHAVPPPLRTIPSGSETSSLMSNASSDASEEVSEGEVGKINVSEWSRASATNGGEEEYGRKAAELGRDDTHGGDVNGNGAGLVHRTKSRSSTVTGAPPSVSAANTARRLSVQDMHELERPESLPVGPAPPPVGDGNDARTSAVAQHARTVRNHHYHLVDGGPTSAPVILPSASTDERLTPRRATARPGSLERTSSTPPPLRRTPQDSARAPSPNRRMPPPPALNLEPSVLPQPGAPPSKRPPSPMPTSIPLPPASLHTHLQLELAGRRPSPLYIHHSHASDMPYESSAIKFERLLSVMTVPPYLERTLTFGALACLDAWLFTFTILPIRWISAVGILASWWGHVLAKEARWVVGFVWYGLGRLWERARSGGGGEGRGRRKGTAVTRTRSETETSDAVMETISRNRSPALASSSTRSSARPASISIHDSHRPFAPSRQRSSTIFRHRRTASQPSNLSSCNKADLLQGALILVTSAALMRLDASRMYHFIRGQSAIKLYVVYNVLEVGDRLLSALGQDILECLFSAETLSRNSSGRSKVLLPFAMFLLALVYNVVHATALYYQVITLNVAVNSYSNALLTLLLSNQFVEVKSTVFKRIEKDNLFQLTCADIVERFTLWIMLLIIALRNVVEVGGLSVPGAGLGGGSGGGGGDDGSGFGMNNAAPRPPPLHTASILPHSFTVLPSWIYTGGVVLSPFLIVIFSEVVVDNIKHAYVVKFNNVKPRFYGRILDIICKDYYTNAFTTPALTRRLGLAVIPMACLFIRSSIQTYNMFLATNLPAPLPVAASTQTSLATTSTPSSAPFLAALDRFDSLLRDALGRSVYNHPYVAAGGVRSWWTWTSDDIIAAATMVVVFFIFFLVLLIAKLVLGMLLLRYARNRYARMKVKELQLQPDAFEAKGRRVGGFAQVEVTDDAKRWVEVDPREGLKKRAPAPGGQQKEPPQPYSGSGVERFEMVAKRIW